MSTPYGGNDPQQWGQVPPPQGYPQQPPSGGFGAPGYPPPQYGQYPPQGYPNQQHPQQQPYYGQQPPGFGAPAPKRGGSGKLLWIVGAVVVVVIAALGVTGFVAPGFFVTKVLDQAAVQDGVKQMLTGYGEAPDSVSCPAKQEVKAGNAFTCTATIGGKPRQITVTVLDANGNYQVSRPPAG